MQYIIFACALWLINPAGVNMAFLLLGRSGASATTRAKVPYTIHERGGSHTGVAVCSLCRGTQIITNGGADEMIGACPKGSSMGAMGALKSRSRHQPCGVETGAGQGGRNVKH